jgi:uncharacterized repeat protein (TIGR03803 family)
MSRDKVGWLGFFRLGAVLSIVVRASVGAADAQALDVLHAFAGTAPTGADLVFPRASLIQDSDGNLYGTTTNAGMSLNGTIFRMTPAGIMTILYTFQVGLQSGGSIAPLARGRDGDLYGMSYSPDSIPPGRSAVKRAASAGFTSGRRLIPRNSLPPRAARDSSPPTVIIPDSGVLILVASQGAAGRFDVLWHRDFGYRWSLGVPG